MRQHFRSDSIENVCQAVTGARQTVVAKADDRMGRMKVFADGYIMLAPEGTLDSNAMFFNCSTPTTHPLLARSPDQARVRNRPDETGPTPGGSLFDRRSWVSIPAAPTVAPAEKRRAAR